MINQQIFPIGSGKTKKLTRREKVAAIYPLLVQLSDLWEQYLRLTKMVTKDEAHRMLMAAVEKLGKFFNDDDSELFFALWQIPEYLGELIDNYEGDEIPSYLLELWLLSIIEKNKFGKRVTPIFVNLMRGEMGLGSYEDTSEYRLLENLQEARRKNQDSSLAPDHGYLTLGEILEWLYVNNSWIERIAIDTGTDPRLLKSIIASEIYWDYAIADSLESTWWWRGFMDTVYGDVSTKDDKVRLPPVGRGPGYAGAHIEDINKACQYLNDNINGFELCDEVLSKDISYLSTPEGAIKVVAIFARYLQEKYGKKFSTPEEGALAFEGYRRYDNLVPEYDATKYTPPNKRNADYVVTMNDVVIEIINQFGEDWFFQHYLSLYTDILALGWYTEDQLKQAGITPEWEGIRHNAQYAYPFSTYFYEGYR